MSISKQCVSGGKVPGKKPKGGSMHHSGSLGKTVSVARPGEQYSLWGSILLHLLPGAIATMVYIVAVPFFRRLGYPSIAALYLPMILAAILIELGYLFYQAQKQGNGRSLNAVVNYREPVPWWMYIAFPLLILIWGLLVTALISPVDNLLLQRVFSWLPNWYALRNLLEVQSTFSRETILIIFVCALLFNGLAGPIVEELYFRGHLLPRISRFGSWAPLLNVVLFSFYHFWTPWQFFSRLVLLLPLVYVVWWKQNIYLGMIAHCLLNLTGTTVLFVQLLGS
jgi:membrane protease YdiL (CAAX protease family)